jgi:hypothetical protein
MLPRLPGAINNQIRTKEEQMSFRNFIGLSVFALFLAGCGTMPATPENVIDDVKAKEMYAKQDTYEVKVPISKVAAVLKEKSSECLQKSIRSTNLQSTGIGTTGYRTTSIVLTPHVLVTKERVRMTIQHKNVSQGTGNLSSMPEDGWYIMVVDAYPVDKQTTRIESYFRYTNYDVMQSAVKSWLTGKNMGCPDLTQ